MQNLVSVIIPVYNVEKYLSRCISSIIKQTYTNIEVICINDGSTDKSLSILQHFQNQHLCIKIIDKDNEGAAKARNIGLEHASGAYIVFIDSDDWISDNYIESLLSTIQQNDADIAICNYIETNGENTDPSHRQRPLCHSENAKDFLFHSIQTGDLSTIVPWGKIFKSKTFDNVRFPTGKHFEDEATIYKAFYNADKIAFTEKGSYFYFKREDSLVSSVYPNHPMDAVEVFEEKYLFFEQRNETSFLSSTLATFCWACLNAYCKEKVQRKALASKLKNAIIKFTKQEATPPYAKILKFFSKHPAIYLFLKKTKSLFAKK